MLRRLFASAVPAGDDPREGSGVALVAVGGYGRQEMSPHSDLDVVLLHDPEVGDDRVREIAEAIWYPIWERGITLDHSVRDTGAMQEVAAKDHRAAMGMLDARTVAGDSGLVLALRSTVLADWRRTARDRVARMRDAREARIERFGWVAHAGVPHIKEGGGGLRDSIDLRALVATWLVDVPQNQIDSLRAELLDIRDVMHEITGRHTDSLPGELVVDVARRLGEEPEDLDLRVRDIGRRTAHIAGVTWRRVEDVLKEPPVRRRVAPIRMIELAKGVGRIGDEVVLSPAADPAGEPEVALRAAVQSARHQLVLNPGAAQRLAVELGDLPTPWPPHARWLLVDLLTAGPGLIPVWEELDFVGVIDRWIPEWSSIRLRGSTSPVHRFTVDRHSLETCVHAAARRHDVDRPDLLVVAALLHDIGKGLDGDHSVVGAPVAEQIALRWGFPAADAAIIGRLVRWHLLISTVATRRDIEDPSTAANVAEIVQTPGFLDLLAVLTGADARATAPSAWSSWRRGLITGLIAKTHVLLDGHDRGSVAPNEYEGWPEDVPFPDLDGADGDLIVSIKNHRGGSLLTVASRDHTGLLAEIAGSLTLQGMAIRSVRTVTHGTVAASLWELERPDVNEAVVAERLRAVLAGDVDLRSRLRPADGDGPTRVRLVPQSNQTATLVEVRTKDRRGLVWAVANAIVENGCTIRSAHLTTYGDEARQVFYVTDPQGDPVDSAVADQVRRQIEAALVGPAA